MQQFNLAEEFGEKERLEDVAGKILERIKVGHTGTPFITHYTTCIEHFSSFVIRFVSTCFVS